MPRNVLIKASSTAFKALTPTPPVRVVLDYQAFPTDKFVITEEEEEEDEEE